MDRTELLMLVTLAAGGALLVWLTTGRARAAEPYQAPAIAAAAPWWTDTEVIVNLKPESERMSDAEYAALLRAKGYNPADYGL